MRRDIRNNKESDPLMSYRSGQQKSEDLVRSQENRAGDLIGGYRHRGSGNNKFRKSDASSREYQVECKQTSNDSIGLKMEWLKKICEEAMGKGKEPVLHLTFNEAESFVGKDWVLIRSDEFKRLLRR